MVHRAPQRSSTDGHHVARDAQEAGRHVQNGKLEVHHGELGRPSFKFAVRVRSEAGHLGVNAQHLALSARR
jgi:hypothetical protein